MFPLLPFAVGIVTGAAAIRLLKNEKARKQLDKAQDRLREATVSSLNVIEHSSARLRTKLDPVADAAPAAVEAIEPVAKPARKRAAPRKSAPKAAPKAAATGQA